MSSNVLLSFTGFHDPYSDGPVEGSKQLGPILSVLSEREFGRVILFSTPSTAELTACTREAIGENFRDVSVQVHHLDLPDPTDYSAILTGLREKIPGIVRADQGRLFIATASGTPQMHACWLLLASSGELPARLLHVRPPRFVSRSTPMVSEVDLSRPEFPVMYSIQDSLAAMPGSPIELDLSITCEDMGIIGDDPAFLVAIMRAVTVAPYNEPVLVEGENGTGKEIIAKLIHQRSKRSGGRLVTVNCSAIPEELAESILFGHKRGSFTGAVRDEQGKFRLADGGTLFLDEVGELSERIQAKLLRAVEYQVIEPVGEGREVTVDVRLVTATHRNLPEMVTAKQFRQDLYYRLRGTSIKLPPLRERRGDISKLAIHFLEKFGRTYQKRWVFTPGALRRLQSHYWPGNVRELEHTVRQAAILCQGRKIESDDLELAVSSQTGQIPDPYPGFSIESYLSDVRKKLFLRALEISGGRQAEAARLLDVSGAAVSKFVKQLAEE